MKIALCHLDLSMGPQEKNIEKLCRAVEMAGERGAEWTITPETAVQGYHFYKTNPAQRLPEQPEPGLVPLLESVKQYKQYLFLGAGEYDTDTHCNFNTCLVFGPDGTLLSRHRKNHSHEFGAENWVKNDTSVRTVVCSNVKVGPLVCADSWYIEDGPMRLEKEGARILLDIAAWPVSKECGDPRPVWEKCSLQTGLPLIVCNQTGKNQWIDFTLAESVYVEEGKAKLAYKGKEAILLFEWDAKMGKSVSSEFTVIPFYR